MEVARDLLDRPAKNGMTALHIAAKHGNAVVVKYLLGRLLSFYAAATFKQAQGRGVAPAKLAEIKTRRAMADAQRDIRREQLEREAEAAKQEDEEEGERSEHQEPSKENPFEEAKKEEEEVESKVWRQFKIKLFRL